MAAHHAAPCIVGWSVISPLGVGRRRFTDGLCGTAPRPSDELFGRRSDWRTLTDFDPPTLIGTRGTRTLDRLTTMVIATTTLVLDEHGVGRPDRSSWGLVLGTNTGSVASIAAFTRDTFVNDRPYLVDPAAFPNTVMNGAAGRTAIWHGLKGLNSTIASGYNTGLAALRYAGRMIRSGHADTLLVGCVEELSDAVILAAKRLREHRPASLPLGEGCVFFLVQRADTAGERARCPLAELVDFEFAVTDRDDQAALADGLAMVIRTVLGRAGVTPSQLWLVSLCHGGDPLLDAAELDAVDRVIGPSDTVRRISATDMIGNTFSALGAFQFAAALAVAESDGAAKPNRLAIVTSVGSDGIVACALITV